MKFIHMTDPAGVVEYGTLGQKGSNKVPLYSRSTGIMEPWATWDQRVPYLHNYIIKDLYVNLLL